MYLQFDLRASQARIKVESIMLQKPSLEKGHRQGPSSGCGSRIGTQSGRNPGEWTHWQKPAVLWRLHFDISHTHLDTFAQILAKSKCKSPWGKNERAVGHLEKSLVGKKGAVGHRPLLSGTCLPPTQSPNPGQFQRNRKASNGLTAEGDQPTPPQSRMPTLDSQATQPCESKGLDALWATYESHSKPGVKMVDAEPCFKNSEGGYPQLFMARGLSPTNLHLRDPCTLTQGGPTPAVLPCHARKGNLPKGTPIHSGLHILDSLWSCTSHWPDSRTDLSIAVGVSCHARLRVEVFGPRRLSVSLGAPRSSSANPCGSSPPVRCAGAMRSERTERSQPFGGMPLETYPNCKKPARCGLLPS